MKANALKTILLLLMAGLSTACSTPDVPYTDPNPPETAWYAYQQCLAANSRSARGPSVCDRAGDTSMQSMYYQTGVADTTSMGYLPYYSSSGACVGGCFNYTGSGGSMSGYYGSGYLVHSQKSSASSESVNSNVNPNVVIMDYLRSLDTEELARLTAHWRQLANESEAAAD